MKQKGRERMNFLSFFLELGCPLFSCPCTLNLLVLGPWSLGFRSFGLSFSPSVLQFLVADDRLWDFSASLIDWVNLFL